MNIQGKATFENEEWILDAGDGKKFKLLGGDLLPRMAGKTLKVVGVEESNFGDAFFGGPVAFIVQRVNVV
ncbi:MAG: hypothetical protein ACI9MC_001667 [Kiritimatiellia bacterium]|jgi:hypothetical protein